MRELSRQDLHDILYGCAVLGTGGGGELAEGFDLIDQAFAAGKSFKLVGIDEVPAEAMVCTPYMLGAISEDTDAKARYANLPRAELHPVLAAYERMENFLGCEFYATVACELGGSNTAISFFAAAMNNRFILDADPAGRAVPEITHSTYYLNGLPAAPIVAANHFGESYICEHIVDDQRAEEVIRALSMVSQNDIAAVDHALPMSELAPALIHGAISTALVLGQALRRAREAGENVAEALAHTGKGFVAFRGEISQCNHRTEGGFTLGEVLIQGAEQYQGDEYHIDIKNENLVGRLNGEVHATIPDLITLIDEKTGEPVTNPNYSIGQKVSVLILPAPEEFLSAKGLAAFGPSYVGLKQDFVPAKPYK